MRKGNEVEPSDFIQSSTRVPCTIRDVTDILLLQQRKLSHLFNELDPDHSIIEIEISFMCRWKNFNSERNKSRENSELSIEFPASPK